MKILITGANGFIGSNLALKLISNGIPCTLIDSLNPNYGGNFFNISSFITFAPTQFYFAIFRYIEYYELFFFRLLLLYAVLFGGARDSLILFCLSLSSSLTHTNKQTQIRVHGNVALLRAQSV